MAAEPGIHEDARGDFVVVGTYTAVSREACGDGAVVVPRGVMLAWVETQTEAWIEQYLRGLR